MEASPNVLSWSMCRSIRNPSKLEWAVLPLNSRSGVRRGQVLRLTSVLQEGTVGVFRDRQPEADLIGTGRDIVDVAVVRVGDPEGRCRVVRGQQGVPAAEAGLPGGRSIRVLRGFSPLAARFVGHARQCGMTLGLDGQVPDERVAVLDAVFQ